MNIALVLGRILSLSDKVEKKLFKIETELSISAFCDHLKTLFKLKKPPLYSAPPNSD
jgi:hypothetical protein